MKKREITFNFDPNDYAGMLEIMDNYGDSDTMYFGTNLNSEEVTISIFNDRLLITTYQSNGFVRKNIYWRDGTREELFDGKWNK